MVILSAIFALNSPTIIAVAAITITISRIRGQATLVIAGDTFPANFLAVPTGSLAAPSIAAAPALSSLSTTFLTAWTVFEPPLSLSTMVPTPSGDYVACSVVLLERMTRIAPKIIQIQGNQTLQILLAYL